MKSKEILPTSMDVISILELKLLAKSIIDHHAKIRMKYLIEGGVWTTHFLSVVMVTEKGLVLCDDANNKIESIPFLNDVTQFIIDEPFDSYNANLTYVVN